MSDIAADDARAACLTRAHKDVVYRVLRLMSSKTYLFIAETLRYALRHERTKPLLIDDERFCYDGAGFALRR